MHIRNLFPGLMTCIALYSQAAVLSVAPGELGNTVTISPSETTLTLQGEINASDLHYIATNLKSLHTLDLSKAEIGEHNGARLAANIHYHPAQTLPAYALSGLSVTNLILPATITAIGDGALMSASITSITIPASVHTIGKGAFADCRSLASVTVPATVTSVGSHIFDGCTALKDVTWSADHIPASAFAECSNLSNVTLGENVNEIGDYAFAGCTSLSTLVFPSRLTSIGSHAFTKSGLTRVDLTSSDALDTLGSYAFALCPSLSSVSLPDKLKTIGEGAFFDDTDLTDLSLAASLTSLPDVALKGATSITDATGLLPEGISTIGTLAMAGMDNAQAISLPSSLTHIGDNAFEGWYSLSSVDAGALQEIPTLGKDVWFGVSQQDATLLVAEGMEKQYAATPQWKEFRIGRSAILDVITDGSIAGSPHITVTTIDNHLHVTSTSPMASARLYDLEGNLLAVNRDINAIETDIDMAYRHATIFILHVTLCDGNSAAIKLAMTH